MSFMIFRPASYTNKLTASVTTLTPHVQLSSESECRTQGAGLAPLTTVLLFFPSSSFPVSHRRITPLCCHYICLNRIMYTTSTAVSVVRWSPLREVKSLVHGHCCSLKFVSPWGSPH